MKTYNCKGWHYIELLAQGREEEAIRMYNEAELNSETFYIIDPIGEDLRHLATLMAKDYKTSREALRHYPKKYQDAFYETGLDWLLIKEIGR